MINIVLSEAIVDMLDVLMYWRDYRLNWADQSASDYPYYWHTNAKKMLELNAGDRLWLVTSGKNINYEAEQAGFLVGIWQVREVVENPADDPVYPPDVYNYRIVADPTASVMFDDPVAVDHILRPPGRDKAVSIGRFLQGPRRLREDKVRMLKSAAGPKMIVTFLNGR